MLFSLPWQNSSIAGLQRREPTQQKSKPPSALKTIELQ
jgi:hypothetical protein